MLRLLSLFIIICLLPCGASFAQGQKEEAPPSAVKAPDADFTELKHTKSGRIDKIIDGLTVLLKDGTIIRLASIDIPDFSIWRDAPYSEEALALLQKTLPEGTEVMMYQTRMAKKGRITRMHHELAHLVTKKDNIWIQGLLLANGLARVYTAPDAAEMLDQMLKTEQEARKSKIGIWADDSPYLILTPETAEKASGEFAIVEGVVESSASVRNDIYLNFGKDWKKDFTIKISPEDRKKLAHKGIDPLGMAHQKLRVRGWIRDYNGPMIELEDPSHLEYPLTEPAETPSEPILQNNDKSPRVESKFLTN